MLHRQVRLRGTWVRENTFPADVTFARKVFSKAVQRGLPFERGVLVVHRPMEQEPLTRTGTFDVTLWVPTVYGASTATRVSRAKTLFRWWMQDTFCRGPRINFDRIDVSVNRGIQFELKEV